MTGNTRKDADDETIAEPFDQTNGHADLEGDSDGTAESDTLSAAERDDESVTVIPPLGHEDSAGPGH